MGIKIVRFCENCLIEMREEIFTYRQDIVGCKKAGSITMLVDFQCEECKKRYKKDEQE